MKKKEILFFGKKRIVACDNKCHKAWGINERPKKQLDNNDPDDYYFLPDQKLGIAPSISKYEECDKNKPVKDELNKWCVRQCERSKIFNLNEEIKLPDFSKPYYNISRNDNNE
jgi:hypothetical protein